MVVKIVRLKVVAKGDEFEETRGQKLVADVDDLMAFSKKKLLTIYNNCSPEQEIVNYEDKGAFCAMLLDMIREYEIPEVPEKAEKAPRTPKQYDIPAKPECRQFREGSKMEIMVCAMLRDEGATIAEMAELAETSDVNVRHRVLRLMPKAGYGIKCDEDQRFYVYVPPYVVPPETKKAAKAREKAEAKAEAEAEQTDQEAAA